MGFRYRKRITIMPGVKVNISKKGLSSVSIGKPGATLNVGKQGVHGTVGVPGTGMSYRTKIGPKKDETKAPKQTYIKQYKNSHEINKQTMKYFLIGLALSIPTFGLSLVWAVYKMIKNLKNLEEL